MTYSSDGKFGWLFVLKIVTSPVIFLVAIILLFNGLYLALLISPLWWIFYVVVIKFSPSFLIVKLGSLTSLKLVGEGTCTDKILKKF